MAEKKPYRPSVNTLVKMLNKAVPHHPRGDKHLGTPPHVEEMLTALEEIKNKHRKVLDDLEKKQSKEYRSMEERHEKEFLALEQKLERSKERTKLEQALQEDYERRAQAHVETRLEVDELKNRLWMDGVTDENLKDARKLLDF